MARVVRRSLFRTILRIDLWAGIGNREQWRHLLRPSHPIRWAWNTWHRASPRNCGAPQEGRGPSSGPAPSAPERTLAGGRALLADAARSHSLRILELRAAGKMRSFSPPLPKAPTVQIRNSISLQEWRKDLLREAVLRPRADVIIRKIRAGQHRRTPSTAEATFFEERPASTQARHLSRIFSTCAAGIGTGGDTSDPRDCRFATLRARRAISVVSARSSAWRMIRRVKALGTKVNIGLSYVSCSGHHCLPRSRRHVGERQAMAAHESPRYDEALR
jgi:hypothetical protein